MNREVLINPLVRWAAIAGDQARLKMLDGHAPINLPHEGDVITAPFIVDPATNQPVPVRVVQIQKHWKEQRHILVVVVARDLRH